MLLYCAFYVESWRSDEDVAFLILKRQQKESVQCFLIFQDWLSITVYCSHVGLTETEVEIARIIPVIY